MPDSREPRPLPTTRSGAYDDPPASSEPSAAHPRRQRLRRAMLGTTAPAPEVVGMASAERQGRSSMVGGLARRRPRSSSELDERAGSTHDDGGGRRRRRSAKRRRLTPGVEAAAAAASTRKAAKYGHYGQVESGRLTLELVSCDGGEHVDARHPATSLGPANLLRHDKSVYCSERPQSNILLKHADDTPFCLEKLHIVGPELGFTAPVRAGVVYVAMTMADLHKYTDPPMHARRSLHSPYRRGERRRFDLATSRSSSPELLTVAEALRDPYISAALEHPPLPPTYAHTPEPDPVEDVYCESAAPPTWPSSATAFIRRSQPVTILSDEDAGPEESSPREVLEYRSQRERMMRRRHDIEDWHRSREAGTGRRGEPGYHPAQGEGEGGGGTRLPSHLSRFIARQRMRASPSNSASPNRTDEEGDEDSEELPPLEPPTPLSRPSHYSDAERGPRSPFHLPGAENEPHDPDVRVARFAIRRGKYKCAIEFQPPVSGRFILLKVWSGEDGGGGIRGSDGRDRNVDVQSVIAKGWMGGMRFFPAVERR